VPGHMSLEDGMGHPVFRKPLFKTGMYMAKKWSPPNGPKIRWSKTGHSKMDPK